MTGAMTVALLLGARLGAGAVELRQDGVRVRVEPLSLPCAEPGWEAELSRAAAEKRADDTVAYGAIFEARGVRDMGELAAADGYLGSPAHRAWAAAAELRSGGCVPASWWTAADPFGGTAGNGPKILPFGRWPSPLARVAFAHDADWTLGRYFGVGPLAPLRDQPYQPASMGQVGLIPKRGPYAEVPIYLRPRRAGWEIRAAPKQ